MRNTYDRTLADCPAPPARDIDRVAGRFWSRPLFLFVVIPKGFFPDEDTGQIFAHHRGGAGHFLRRDEANIRWRRRKSSPPTRTSTASCPPSALAVILHLEQRPHFHAPETAFRTQIERGPDHSGTPPETRADSRHQRYLQNPPLIRVGGMLTKALYQFSLQDTDTKELFHWAPILMDKIAASNPVSGRDQRPANRQPADQRGN